jgi:hypothetical protein
LLNDENDLIEGLSTLTTDTDREVVKDVAETPPINVTHGTERVSIEPYTVPAHTGDGNPASRYNDALEFVMTNITLYDVLFVPNVDGLLAVNPGTVDGHSMMPDVDAPGALIIDDDPKVPPMFRLFAVPPPVPTRSDDTSVIVTEAPFVPQYNAPGIVVMKRVFNDTRLSAGPPFNATPVVVYKNGLL